MQLHLSYIALPSSSFYIPNSRCSTLSKNEVTFKFFLHVKFVNLISTKNLFHLKQLNVHRNDCQQTPKHLLIKLTFPRENLASNF